MCLICDRIQSAKNGTNSYVIKEFKHSFFVIGDHQYFKGYSQLILKEHVQDITDLDENIQREYMEEVFQAGKLLKRIFNPVRINYSCLGNFVPHVHFHLFPRYEEDLKLDETKNPWHNMDEFKKYTLGEEEAKTLAKQIALSGN